MFVTDAEEVIGSTPYQKFQSFSREIILDDAFSGYGHWIVVFVSVLLLRKLGRNRIVNWNAPSSVICFC